MKTIILAIIATAIVAVGSTWYFLNLGKGSIINEPSKSISFEPVNDIDEKLDEEYFNEAELVDFTKQYINVLQRLYYINHDDSTDADTVSGLIISMLTEAMKDRDNLEKLHYTTSQMKESKILGAEVTGLVLDVSIQQLIDTHNEYINFLRGVDETTANIAEFQYQIAQFQSSTKSIYLSMAENTGVFPLTFLKLNDDPNKSGTWRISKESQKEVLDEIELRFADIFIETEQQYLETQTRDVTVFIIQHLKEFFETVQ